MAALLPAAEAVAGNPAAALLVLFALIIGHALCDFALQPEFIALGKNRHADLSRFFGGKPQPRGLWIHLLGAHCLIHAGAVWIITGSVLLAAVEFVLHAIIDFVKCEGKTSFTADQLLHYGCRILYVIALYLGWSCLTWTPA
ncbi:MAG: DUF3307 domain-containing protein [Verrucomicrobia bacterium]|nr:DUF3307 domain-containing protein [Verrucomicrobiota bacterium]